MNNANSSSIATPKMWQSLTNEEESPQNIRAVRRLVLPALVMSRFSNQGPSILTSLLLVDMGLSFGVSVGIMGQIMTAAGAIGIVSALLMGILSLRFRHRSLLLIGLLVQTITALGCSVAPDYGSLLILYSMCGLGIAMVTPMGLALVAEYYPVEKRSSAIGWILSGASLSYLVGYPSVGLIAAYGGWRTAFLVFVALVSLFSFILAYRGLPKTASDLRPKTSSRGFQEGFGAILTNRSACACLIGTATSWTCFQLSLLYGASFLRQSLLLTTGTVAILTMGTAAFFTVGSISGGRLVRRMGRKPLVTLSALFTAVLTVLFVNLVEMWFCIATLYLANLFSGMRFTSSSSLTLEQVPTYRGTMMSITTAADIAGATLGAGLGGWMILTSGYGAAGFALGGLGLVSTIVYLIFTVDPTKTKNA